MSTQLEQCKRIIEVLLMVSQEPLAIKQLTNLLKNEENITELQVKNIIDELTLEYTDKGLELRELASGYRLQVRTDFGKWVNKLFEEKPPKYSRALLETLAIIVYKQPITRAEVENIRGVSVGSGIIKTLLDREWIKIVGHKNVPGKPSLYITTKQFLDYFNLKSLSDLPNLNNLISENKTIEQLEIEL